MADERKGPYKVLVTPGDHRTGPTWSIVVEQRDNFLKMLVPDAGESATARQLCNFLNRNHREVLENLKSGEGWQVPSEEKYDFTMGLGQEVFDNDPVRGTDESGVSDQDI